MSDIILSVREPYLSNILNGSNIIWVRTKPILKFERGDVVYFAEPGTHGNVVGNAICTATQIATPKFAWEHYKHMMGMTFDDFNQYTQNHDTIFLIWLTLPCLWDKPRHISEYGFKRIPQSYCYV